MPKHKWAANAAQAWYDKQPWPVGCNFLPSTAINATEMWQGESFDAPTIRRELSWAADLGFNSVRVFLPYVVWQADAGGLIARLEHFLDIAAALGIRVMPVLFDDCHFSGKQPYLGKQDDPIPGVHNSGWVPSPGADIAGDERNWPGLEHYITGIAGRFADDERIIVWDLYNEPGADKDFDSGPLLKATFQWARQAGPSQPLTAAVFRGKLDGSATLEDLAAADDRIRTMLDNSDVLSFHNYCDLDWATGCIATFKAGGRPVFCTEWMARGPMGSLFQTHLPLWKAQKVGCYNWGLVAGKTQTYLPWDNPARKAEPEVWHHDILRPDGTPFDSAEIEVIRNCTGA